MRSFIIASGLVAAVRAFTPPTDATWGPLTKPDLSNPVTQGETFEVTWDPETHPTDGVTVSLVLCRGPGSNCVTDTTAIVEGVPADAKSYSWDVPCDLAAGEASTATGYGMLIIVDGTGEFQYSTQFSVLEGECGAGGSSSASVSSTKSGYGAGSWTTKGWDSSYPANASTPYTQGPRPTYTPTSLVYATNTEGTSFSTVAASSAGPTETFSFGGASEATASAFTGAAALPTGNVANVFGLVAGGALAMLAL